MNLKAVLPDASPRNPETVYHYTSIRSMMSIVKSRALWCTAISYLNDQTERQFLLGAIRRRLPTLMYSDQRIGLNIIKLVPTRPTSYQVTSFADEPFVTSFTVQEDSLMHWRSYVPQSESGVAIGFRVASLSQAQIDEKPEEGMVIPRIWFSEIQYVDPNSDSSVDVFVSWLLNSYESYSDAKAKTPEAVRMSPEEHFWWLAEYVAGSSKHASFSVEAEYRLLLSNVAYRENNIQFRTVRSTLVPYVSLSIPSTVRMPESENLPWDAISEVIIGPTPNMDLTERSLVAYFKLHGLRTAVHRSEVPYRDW